MNMLRRLLVYSMILTLTVTTVACGGGPSANNTAGSPSSQEAANVQSPQNRLADGQYPVQQATYNDANGEYNLMLLNTKAGDSPTYRTENLQMARLTNEEATKGQKSYLKVENGQPSLYLTEDFKIEYVHNVTETQTNPQTGQQETVVVRQESSFWTPFAGALAGQALGSLLFRPQYYVPPIYQPGGALTGYGGYGRTYDDAVGNYRQRYNAPPAAVRNRQTFRATGGQNRFGSSGSQRSGDRSSGTGYGSNTLRRSNSGSNYQKRSPSGFGSSSRSRSAGRRR